MDWPADQPPWTQDETRTARVRPEVRRTALPFAGERVLYRAAAWGPEVPAVITAVQDMEVPGDANGGGDIADLHVWEHPDPQVPAASWAHPRVRGELRLTADPWPRVTLDLGGGRSAACREARVRGAPGWLRAADGGWLHERRHG
jgi:hypothetical protein